MDAAGAELVRQRIEAHENWRTAAAVRDGRQPATDPDREQLVEFSDGLRLYASQERHEIVDGSHALTSYRVTKRLVEGSWEREVIAVDAQLVA
jgi:hypothetical protein